MSHVATYLRLLQQSEQSLAEAFRRIGEGHVAEADVFHTCTLLAGWSEEHVARLTPLVARWEADNELEEPERLHHKLANTVRGTAVGLLRDLQDLHLLATLVQTSWTVIWDAAQGARDRELMAVAQECNTQTSRQLTWLVTRMKQAAPQALLVAT